VYKFVRLLNKRYDGYINREVELECTVSSGRAQVIWMKGDKVLKDGDEYEISKDATGVCRLVIKKAKQSDSGKYSCKLEKQDDKTETQLTCVGK